MSRGATTVRWALCGLLGLSSPWAAAAPEAWVGVPPFSGNAPAAERAEARRALEQSLLGLPGLEKVALDPLETILPPAQVEGYRACGDDACRRAALNPIRADHLIFGELDVDGPRRLLRLRAVAGDPAAPAEPKVRISRELGDRSMTQVMAEVVAELFPEAYRSAFATLNLRGEVEGTMVALDGKLVGTLEGGGLALTRRLGPGPHHLEARAPGHQPLVVDLTLVVGETRDLQLALIKNRSVAPYVLGGLGVLAAGVATGLGLAVQGRVGEWEEACPGGQLCAAGFTKARYDEDQAFVDQGRLGSNALWAVAGAALVSAVVWYVFDPGSDPELVEGGP